MVLNARNRKRRQCFANKQPDFGHANAVKVTNGNGQLMTALLTEPRELKLLSQFAQSALTRSSRGVSAAGVESACTAESIRVRAEAVTPVLKRILEIRPPRHWGINE